MPTFTPAVPPPFSAPTQNSGEAASAASTAPREISATVSAYKQPLSIVYGRSFVPSRLVTIAVNSAETKNVFLHALAVGEIDAFEQSWWDDTDITDTFGFLAAGGEQNVFTGTLTQTEDPFLNDAIPGYNDDLPGVVYASSRIQFSEITSVPRMEALLRGFTKIRDPRGPSSGYTDNPSLCLADFIEKFIPDAIVEDAGLIACADANDENVGGDPRRRWGQFFDQIKNVWDYVPIITAYAALYIHREGNQYFFTPDRPWTDPIEIFDNRRIITDSGKISLGGVAEIPDVVNITWFDLDERMQRTYQHPVSPPSLNTQHNLRLLGIHDYAQAVREAEERFNRLTLEALTTGSFETFDEALTLRIGQVINVTDLQTGFDSTVRVIAMRSLGIGRYRVDWQLYDVSIYSNANPADPGAPVERPPQIFSIEPPASVTTTIIGGAIPIVRVEWTDPVGFPAGFISGYDVEMSSDEGSGSAFAAYTGLGGVINFGTGTVATVATGCVKTVAINDRRSTQVCDSEP